MRGVVWNVWRLRRYGRWQYPSYVSWLSCCVWNVCLFIGYDLPDRQWAYLVCLGARGKVLIDSET